MVVHSHCQLALSDRFMSLTAQYPEPRPQLLQPQIVSGTIIHKNNFQLLGVTALGIAMKMEEVTTLSTHQLIKTTDGAYTAVSDSRFSIFMLTVLFLLKAEVTKSERDILKVLSWNLRPCTSHWWLNFFLCRLARLVRLFVCAFESACSGSNDPPTKTRPE